MQGWQFDDLTRTLGKATSRRQVIKGLLGGLGAALLGRSLSGRALPPSEALAAPAEVCDRQSCLNQAFGLFKICTNNCNALSSRHGYRHQEKLACVLGCTTAYELEKYECQNNATGCFGNNACCSQQCVVLDNDPKNCGACGNVCPDGSKCIGGQCHCQDGGTLCDGQCINTRTDPQHCGDCDTKCATCQTCRNGRCVARHCADGFVCCNDECVPLCPNGDAPDPTTCQCNVCSGQIDGAACDANDPTKLCCQEQCVSSQCPSGKTFSLDTCRCQCTSTCPPGQLQDPDTCQCQDLCADASCPECQTCDPTSGDCVPADDQTPCGTDQVCCSGACQDSCGPCAGLPCSNGDCCPNNTDWACCQNGCCPQVTINGQTGAWCVAPGPLTGPLGGPSGNCCAPADLVKLSVVDPTTNACACSEPGVAFGVACAGNLPPNTAYTTYCSCGSWGF